MPIVQGLEFRGYSRLRQEVEEWMPVAANMYPINSTVVSLRTTSRKLFFEERRGCA